MNKTSIIILAVATFALISDRAHKIFMLDIYGIQIGETIRLTSFFDLVMVWNKGISYGLFQQSNPSAQLIMAIGAIIIAALFLILAFWRNRRGEAIALALISGGAASNAIDRLLYGAVADFISLHVGNFYWYVFNLADIWIVGGAALYIYVNLGADHSRNQQLG